MVLTALERTLVNTPLRYVRGGKRDDHESFVQRCQCLSLYPWAARGSEYGMEIIYSSLSLAPFAFFGG